MSSEPEMSKLETVGFWEQHPKGIPIEALFGDQGGMGDIGKRLRAADKDGNGCLSKDEFRQSLGLEIEKAANEKAKKEKITKALVILAVAFACLVGVLAGVTFAVVEMAKDTATGNDGIMKVKGSEEKVKVASADFEIDANGTMVARGNKDGSLVVEAREAAQKEAALDSRLSDSTFREMKRFELVTEKATLSLVSHGFVRLQQNASLHGSVVVIVTHLGRVTLDGEVLSFTSDIGRVFEDAGLPVRKDGRRLLGLYDLIAFFNSIPLSAYDDFDAEVDGPRPSFPAKFKVRQSKYELCDATDPDGGELLEQCKGVPAHWLIERDGVKYMPSFSTMIVDSALKVDRTETMLPLRSSVYTHVTTRHEGPKGKLVKGAFMAKASASALTWPAADGAWPVGGAAVADTTQGWWCHLGVAGAMLPEDVAASQDGHDVVVSAKYLGIEDVDGVPARSFRYMTSATEFPWLLYDAKDEASGLHLPLKLVSLDTDGTSILAIFNFRDWDLNVDTADMQSKGLFALPAKCPGNGDGVVPVAELIFSDSPAPAADVRIAAHIISEDKKNAADRRRLGEAAWHGVRSERPGPAQFTFRPELHPEVHPGYHNLDASAEDIAAWQAARDASDGNATQAGRRRLQGASVGRRLLGYSCCVGEVFPEDSYMRGSSISRSYDLGAVSLELGYATYFTDGGGTRMCYANGGVELRSGLITVTGSIYIDLDPASMGASCMEYGGCITVDFGLKVASLEFTLFSTTLCMIGGRASDSNNCMRPYAALQLAIEVGNCDWVGCISGSLFLKNWFPNSDCARYHSFDPYLQYDVKFPCFFYSCHNWPSKAWHILGDPGHKWGEYSADFDADNKKALKEAEPVSNQDAPPSHLCAGEGEYCPCVGTILFGRKFDEGTPGAGKTLQTISDVVHNGAYIKVAQKEQHQPPFEPVDPFWGGIMNDYGSQEYNPIEYMGPEEDPSFVMCELASFGGQADPAPDAYKACFCNYYNEESMEPDPTSRPMDYEYFNQFNKWDFAGW